LELGIIKKRRAKMKNAAGEGIKLKAGKLRTSTIGTSLDVHILILT